jgi:hypothetical protein
LILLALLVGGCAQSGDDVANEDVGQVAGVLSQYWTYSKPHQVQTAEEIVSDQAAINDAIFTSGVENAVVEPLSSRGKTDDPGGAKIEMLISVDTIKNGNGVLVRRNTAGSKTRCFRYVAKHTDVGVDTTYKEFTCPKG